MTYIDYLNSFNLWLESNALPANSQLMFFKFLNVFNRAGWPEYVQVDTLRLMLMIDTSDKRTAYRARDGLVDAKFISYDKGSKGKPSRYYLLSQNATVYATVNATLSGTENGTQNSTLLYTNNINNNTIEKTKNKTKTNIYRTEPEIDSVERGTSVRKKFIPPTVEEVKEYCRDRKNGINAEQFVDFYASKGWMIGKSPMKDWKAAIRTWEKNRTRCGERDRSDRNRIPTEEEYRMGEDFFGGSSA